MKKVSLILLVVILASVALMAATPLKLVRLTFINKSGHVVYIKLEGKVEGNFYYLTVPYGTKEIPDDVTFTVMQDVYTRTTWYGPGDYECEGTKSSGELWAIKHSKFVFTPCNQRVNTWGEPTWGPASEGLQCRLARDRRKWGAGETPTFKFDLRNRGERTFAFWPAHKLELVQIEFDGKWHRWPEPVKIDSNVWPLPPGERYSGVTIELHERFNIDTTAGKHIIRIAFNLEGVRVISNPVGIQILAR